MKERLPELGYLFGCYFHQDWAIEGRPDIVKAATNQLGQFLAMHLDTERLEAALDELGNFYYPRPATSHEAWLHEPWQFLRQHQPA